MALKLGQVQRNTSCCLRQGRLRLNLQAAPILRTFLKASPDFFPFERGLCQRLLCAAVPVAAITTAGKAVRSSDQTVHAEEGKKI